jgi:hypothetical protein
MFSIKDASFTLLDAWFYLVANLEISGANWWLALWSHANIKCYSSSVNIKPDIYFITTQVATSIS